MRRRGRGACSRWRLGNRLGVRIAPGVDADKPVRLRATAAFVLETGARTPTLGDAAGRDDGADYICELRRRDA